MIRGFFNKFNRSFKNLQNVIFHVKLLSPTLIQAVFIAILEYLSDFAHFGVILFVGTSFIIFRTKMLRNSVKSRY